MAPAEIPPISDSMKLNCDSYDISSVSQSVFPGPNPLVLQRPQKYPVFPEAIVKASLQRMVTSANMKAEDMDQATPRTLTSG